MEYLSKEAIIARKSYRAVHEKISALKLFPSLGREGRILGTKELD